VNVPMLRHAPPPVRWSTTTLWLPVDVTTVNGVALLYPASAGYQTSTR
jgi:hypothetical protein